jgi:hypothetical protein
MLPVINDPVSATSTTGVIASPYTGFSYPVSAGPNRLLVLAIAQGDVDGRVTSGAPTWGGRTMTAAGSADEGAWCGAQLYILRDAEIVLASGSQFSIPLTNIVLSQLGLTAVCYRNVNQSTAIGTPVTGTGFSTNPGPLAVAAGREDLVIGVVSSDTQDATVLSVAAPGVELAEIGQIQGDLSISVQVARGDGGTVNVSWVDATSDRWAAVAVRIIGAGLPDSNFVSWPQRMAC